MVFWSIQKSFTGMHIERCAIAMESILKRLGRSVSREASYTSQEIRVRIDQLQSQHHCFSAIKKWFARESHINPKPAPDGYHAACLFFGVVPERCVGFEDSLIIAGVKPILDQKYDIPRSKFLYSKGDYDSVLNGINWMICSKAGFKSLDRIGIEACCRNVIATSSGGENHRNGNVDPIPRDT
ncbi:hypothetical protein ACTFIW_007132 [Dictyostelium discoideum]